MANTRIKDLSNTASTVPSDAFLALDGAAGGTAKIGRDNLRQDTADAIAAAPATYNLAPLTSGSVDVDKGGTGSTTVAGAKTNLEIINVGTAANEVPLNGMLNSGAWLDFDAFFSTGNWTPTVSFGGGSTGVTYNNQYGHYTKTGNMVTVQGFVYLSSKGSDTGTALLNGLPFPVSAAGDAVASVVVGASEVMIGLTSPITGRVVGSGIYLYDWGATGIATLTDANFGASAIRFSATYQIA